MLSGSCQADLGISHHLLIDAEAGRAEVLKNKLSFFLFSLSFTLSLTFPLIYALIFEMYS